jgi:hypothetical protein
MMSYDEPPGEQAAAPELREQVSAARDRVFELLLVVVGISGALGLVTNLLVSWAHDGTLSANEWLLLVGASAAAVLFALVAAARLRLSTRELDEEIELALPLLVPAGGSATQLEVFEVSAYSAVTELGHAAVAKLPVELCAALTLAARRIDRGSARGGATLTLLSTADDDGEEDEPGSGPTLPVAASDDPVLWLLQLTQLLIVAECLDESERLLGPEAIFHRGRWLRRRTPHLRDVTWDELVKGVGSPAQPFLALRALPGVRQRTSIPAMARLTLADVAAELGVAKRRSASRRGGAQTRAEEALLVPLLRLDAGRAGSLVVQGVGRVSAHAAPRPGQPAAGLTTRVFLRNARDPDLRRRALEEEALATMRLESGVPRPGIRPPGAETSVAVAIGSEGVAAEHTRAWRALYRGGRRPRVARIYLTAQGRFQVRLSGRGRLADQALYAWATALARRIGTLDVDVLMARLAARGQMVPQRRF